VSMENGAVFKTRFAEGCDVYFTGFDMGHLSQNSG
jgi:hypothetical protein